jgi:hypothetical protein
MKQKKQKENKTSEESNKWNEELRKAEKPEEIVFGDLANEIQLPKYQG